MKTRNGEYSDRTQGKRIAAEFVNAMIEEGIEVSDVKIAINCVRTGFNTIISKTEKSLHREMMRHSVMSNALSHVISSDQVSRCGYIFQRAFFFNFDTPWSTMFADNPYRYLAPLTPKPLRNRRR